DGDTIVIPKGTCTWDQSVTLDADKRSLRLHGDEAGGTIIAAKIDRPLMDGEGDAIVGIGGTSKSWRIHHLDFETNGVPLRIFRTYGSAYGVIDHCTV